MAAQASQLRILRYPDPVLRKRAAAIDAITPQVREVAARMIQLMHEAEGVGLAAPQVGFSWRMFVTLGLGENDPDLVYINPRLSEHSRDLEVHEEGCLSLPGINAEIRRPGQVTITATDLEGNPFTFTAQGLHARAWQHEMDHLDGLLIIDKMNPLDRLANRKAIRELEAAAQG